MTRRRPEMSQDEARRQHAVSLLAAGVSQVDVAEELGVNQRTVRRWVAEPEFSAAVDAMSEAISSAALARIKALTGSAIEALGDIVHHAGDPKDRIAAAKAILDRVVPATQKHEVKAAAEMSTEQIEAELRKLGYKRTE